MTTEDAYTAARRRGDNPTAKLADRAAANREATDLRRIIGPYRAAQIDDQVRDETLRAMARPISWVGARD